MNAITKLKTKTEILEYIQFRASGIGQAPNYTYKDFYNEIVEMQRNEVKKINYSCCCKSDSEQLCDEGNLAKTI